jgi:hypothetical protein
LSLFISRPKLFKFFNPAMLDGMDPVRSFKPRPAVGLTPCGGSSTPPPPRGQGGGCYLLPQHAAGANFLAMCCLAQQRKHLHEAVTK